MTSMPMPSKAVARCQVVEKGYFKNSVISIKDQNGLTILDHDEHMRPTTDMQALGQLNPSFVMPGEMGGFNAVGIQAHPEIETVNHVHHAGNSSGIVDGAAGVLVGSGRLARPSTSSRVRAFVLSPISAPNRRSC